jgi:oxygen-independent coproporphyrinogen-3 oxidase
MNRAHNAEQALRCVGYAQEAGITNITIDLIYGVPGLSDEAWKENIRKAFELGIDHISCYALTVEPKTALATMIRQHKVAEVDDALASRQFKILMEECEKHGFEHYEISNFARNKKYSKHNTSYWKGTKYLGAGPSAHSFDHESRQWNVYNNQTYLRSMRENKVPFEREELTKKDKYNEYILTSLRTMWGINIDVIQERFGEAQANILRSKMQEFIDEGKISQNNSIFTLTREGKYFADKISAELFF